uniref:Variant surface glycoprotein 1125.1296 n=1 Tax=Trypanosoma brucei TaxID=5691 RepID=M4SV84_9TRYP|nr:variant surface glycoprotein 1351 [Trypanosoma brucei]APD73524.1 variant surface glycoprotein 1125.1296 [Trypanosoma brucei]
MINKRQAASIILLPLTFLSMKGQPAANMGVLKTSWEPLCQATTDLNKVPSNVASSLKRASMAIRDMLLESRRAAIYAQMHGTTENARKAAVIDANMFATAIRGLNHLINNDLTKGADLINKAAYLKGSIDDFLNLASGVKQGGEGCLVDTGATVTSNFNKKTAGTTECVTTLSPTTAEETKLTHLTPAGHSKAIAGTTEENNQQAAGTANCRLFSGDSTNGLAKTNNLAAPILWAAGYYKVKAGAGGEVSIADLRPGTLTTSPDHKQWTDFFSALAQKPDHEHANYANNSQNLHSDDLTEKLLVRALLNDATKSAEDAKNKREGIFGKPADNAHTKIFATISDQKLPDKTGGVEAGTTLGSLKDATTLAAVLLSFELANMDKAQQKKELEAKKEKESTSLWETECNKIKDEGKCNATAACSFNKT